MASAKIKVGDLVRLNSKGRRFMKGKATSNNYYSPLLGNIYGIVTEIHDRTTVRVRWNTIPISINMLMYSRYLEKMNRWK
jgi:small-conductance mechanosensitive channel